MRWWADPAEARHALGLVDEHDPQVGLGVALLGYHGIAASALASLPPVADGSTVREVLGGLDLEPVVKAVGRAVGSVSDAPEAYSRLMVEDLHGRATDATVGLIRRMQSSGVAWPFAVSRAAAVHGVPEERLGAYAGRMTAPVVVDLLRDDAADRLLHEYASELGAAVVGAAEVSKAARGRAMPDEEEWDPKEHPRDESGRFTSVSGAGAGERNYEAEAYDRRRLKRIKRRVDSVKEQREQIAQAKAAEERERIALEERARLAAAAESAKRPELASSDLRDLARAAGPGGARVVRARRRVVAEPEVDVEPPKPEADAEPPKPKVDVELPKPKADPEPPGRRAFSRSKAGRVVKQEAATETLDEWSTTGAIPMTVDVLDTIQSYLSVGGSRVMVSVSNGEITYWTRQMGSWTAHEPVEAQPGRFNMQEHGSLEPLHFDASSSGSSAADLRSSVKSILDKFGYDIAFDAVVAEMDSPGQGDANYTAAANLEDIVNHVARLTEGSSLTMMQSGDQVTLSLAAQLRLDGKHVAGVKGQNGVRLADGFYEITGHSTKAFATDVTIESKNLGPQELSMISEFSIKPIDARDDFYFMDEGDQALTLQQDIKRYSDELASYRSTAQAKEVTTLTGTGADAFTSSTGDTYLTLSDRINLNTKMNGLKGVISGKKMTLREMLKESVLPY